MAAASAEKGMKNSELYVAISVTSLPRPLRLIANISMGT